jgi:GTPase SAR1 family protein
MFDTYSKAKNELNSELIRLENIATSDRVKTAFHLLREKLEAGVFSLVVAGQFKRGKTTFINALLGENLLPTAVIPLTSIVTVISFGKDLKIEAVFQDGRRQAIGPNELPLYVTERHNPKNEKLVDRVEIEHPSPYLEGGVRIVDTPGIASIHEHNTRTTYDYLPQADAAVFLLSVDPPITQAELHFLRDVAKLTARVFFILNKTDTMGEAERDESLAFSKQAIEEGTGFRDVTIYPISARLALEGKLENDRRKTEQSGLPAFERSLEAFLAGEKGSVLIRSIADKARSWLNEELFIAELEERSRCISLDELENKISAFKTFIRDSEQEKDDSGRLFFEDVKVLRERALIDDIEEMKDKETKELDSRLDEFSIEHAADGNAEFAAGLNTLIGTHIRDAFGAWRVEEEKRLEARLKEISERFVFRMNQILERMSRFSSELFGTSDRRFGVREALPPQVEYRYQTEDPADMLSLTVDLAKKALPKALSHKLFLKEAKKSAAAMVDRHCGKARYDFSERLERLAQNYRRSVAEFVDSAQNDAIRALEKALTDRHEAAAKGKAGEAAVAERVMALNEIDKSLADFTKSV